MKENKRGSIEKWTKKFFILWNNTKIKNGFDKMYKNRFAYVCIAPKKLLHFNKNRETVDRIKNVEYNYKWKYGNCAAFYTLFYNARFTSILSTLYNSVRYYSFINHFIIKIFMRGANSNDKQKE